MNKSDKILSNFGSHHFLNYLKTVLEKRIEVSSFVHFILSGEYISALHFGSSRWTNRSTIKPSIIAHFGCSGLRWFDCQFASI